MAGLTWIFFGICIVTVSAHFGYNNGENPFFRQSLEDRRQRPDALLRALQQHHLLKQHQLLKQQHQEQLQQQQQQEQPKAEEHKCFTLARRPFYMTRPMQYPCSRRMNGIPVAQSFMGPFGPMCVSYFREPVHRYYKIHMCCPGYSADNEGRCTIRGRRQQTTPEPRAPMPDHHNIMHENMMSMAAKMRSMMWMKAKAAMARKRTMLMMDMLRARQAEREREQIPVMPPRIPRPPTSPVDPRMFNRPMHPRMFNRPEMSLPSPRPAQRPPVNGRFIKVVRRPLILSTVFRLPLSFGSSRQPPRMVLSNRASNEQINAEKFHPAMPPMPRFRPIPRMFRPQEEFAQGADNGQNDIAMGDSYGSDADFRVSDGQGMSDIQVNLPEKPIEMPKLMVEQAPQQHGEPITCIITLNSAVKTCLSQNNLNVPDVMSAFGSMNEEMANTICQLEDAIFSCITESLQSCAGAGDEQTARGMLMETADTVRSMCLHRDMMVGHPDVIQAEQNQMTAAAVPENNEATSSTKSQDTVATVENVDAIPTDVKSGTQPEQITVLEETIPRAEEGIKQAIRHEVHVQEMEMKEYYLPLLIGSGVGFMLLVLCTALLICCCCKRRLRKKMKMAKEMEKPPLSDEIYTIGIAPPTYEVNGIPPMYYEEAKGEKITSRDSSIQEGEEASEGEGKEM